MVKREKKRERERKRMRKSGERRTILVVPNRERSATELRHIFNWSNRRIKRRRDVDDAVMILMSTIVDR